MSLIIYHKNLDVLTRNKLSKEFSEDYYKHLGAKLVITGLKAFRNINFQIKVYEEYILKIQGIKRYKLKQSDIDYYCCCVLALWKLGRYNPDSDNDPLYITPSIRKKKSTIIARLGSVI